MQPINFNQILKVIVLLIPLFSKLSIVAAQDFKDFQSLFNLRDKSVEHVTKYLLEHDWQVIKEGLDNNNKMEYKGFLHEKSALKILWFPILNRVAVIELRCPDKTFYLNAHEWINSNNVKFKETQLNKLPNDIGYTLTSYYTKESASSQDIPISTLISVVTYLTNDDVIIGYDYNIMY